MIKKDIIGEFDEKEGVFLSLESMTKSLLEALISSEKLQIHSITSRTKQRESLLGKIKRPNKSYDRLLDITDIVGFRITTYFSEDVDVIARIIEKEFSIDPDNSIDKRKALEPDRFGYMSLHLVCEHKNARLKLPEYKQYKSIKFEVQIRSILQHAWAEIEHDIGYKSTNEVPDLLKRRFSRLAGLLELADEEFQSIKDGIKNYRSSLPEQLGSAPDDVTLDLESLTYFVNTDPSITKLEEEMLKYFKYPVLNNAQQASVSNSLEFLNRQGIQTVGELILKYKEVEQYIVPFLKVWLSKDHSSESLSRGISLLYLTYINLATHGDQDHSEFVLKAAPFMNVSDLVEEINEAWLKI
ncbi:GTP pyrophosphokinase [Photobacterium sanguinicancri]|uniref:RelA/SpoT domain-containing protein n=1 Tax=Photobacterium sanguinicancri TaxID=875932 RepID=A0AAW7YE23_9GAMM|nr:hypothetical protein [Photobacterium sanguinicancri]MDO6545533.1 hypothetical protein [Photobacterium sanguinicancri]